MNKSITSASPASTEDQTSQVQLQSTQLIREYHQQMIEGMLDLQSQLCEKEVIDVMKQDLDLDDHIMVQI